MEGEMDPDRVVSGYLGEMESSVFRELEIAGQHARVMYGNPLLRNMLFRIKGESFCNRLIDVMTGETGYEEMGGPLRQLFS
jgi:hypothetical protein